MAATVAVLGTLAAACATAVGPPMTPMRHAAPAPSDPSPSPSPPGGLARFYRQKPSWSGCGDRFQCATVAVPRDYDKPEGRQFKISVIRMPARDRAHRIGSLLTNPGGPGESGVTFIRRYGTSFGDALQARFDIVGFDPRGVGRSNPVRCSGSPQLARQALSDPPTTPTEVNAQVSAVKAFVAACLARSGSDLPYVGTANAARDMDVIRAVLGDRRLSYVGFSYGTFLGATYADRFPQNVRAMVLDGAEDPKLTAQEEDLQQAQGFETALRAFATYCVKTPGCPLGTGSVDDALAKVSELQETADRTPLPNRSGNHKPVDEDTVTDGITTALYSRDTWPTLRTALTQAIEHHDGTAFAQLAGSGPVQGPARAPVQARVQASIQAPARTPAQAPVRALTRSADVGGGESQLFAIDCVDRRYPASVAAVEAEAAEAKRIAPHFGPSIVWPSLTCVLWPVKTARPPRPLTAAGAPPILVIGTTRDPATPYSWAEGLADELTSGVLLTFNGDGHTAYLQGHACVDEAVENYLINLRAPAPGTVCEQSTPDTGESVGNHPS